MNGYTTFWTKDFVKQLEKHNDKGPYCVIFGSRHMAMPSIGSLKVGDIVYPVCIKQRTLCVMARLKIEKIEPAYDYLIRETGLRHGALIPEGILIQSQESHGQYNMFSGGSGYTGKVEIPENIHTILQEEEFVEIPHKFHQEPISCCAKLAASGSGTMIEEHIIPLDDVMTFLFFDSKKKMLSPRLDRYGGLSTMYLSNRTRKMSPETFRYFENIFA